MKNNRKKIIIIIIFILILVISLGVVYLFKNMNTKDYYQLQSRIDNIDKTVVIDSEAYGWVMVQGTDIDTPIVNVTDSVYEDIYHDYLWIAPYYKSSENRKVIYGHNIRNVSNDPDIVNKDHFRFEQLMSFVSYDFAKENLYIQYSTKNEEALYKIYAVSFNNLSDEYGRSYSKDEVSDYIKSAIDNSIYKYDVDVNKNDEIISLITCTRYFGTSEKTQFRVDARRVRQNEKISKYSVEMTSNYDIIK